MSTLSIIIRTHNEEKWIGECLRSISSQTIDDYEIILVDNASTDKTVEKAKNFRPDLTLVSIEEYRPGRALNKGICASSGEFIVCLSAHCIPAEDDWLETLYANFDAERSVAGVYGRQVPVESSDPVDKRDLLRMFGAGKRVQTEDTFFHNANSMVRRDVWEQYPFDEEVTNIEDQIWANEVLTEGYTIIYEPEAAVYHHHGINQGNNEERMRNVVRTMENKILLGENDIAAKFDANPINPAEIDIVSFIPIRQQTDSGADTNEELIHETITTVQEAEYIDDTFISTDTATITEKAPEWNVTGVIERPIELSAEDVDALEVYKYTLEQLEAKGRYPDLVVTLDITHPFRPPGLLDDVIQYLITNGHDTVVPVYPEYRPSWISDGGTIRHLNQGTTRAERDPVHVGLFSLGTAIYPNVLREADRLAGDLGLYEIENPLATIEVRDEEDLKYWERIRDVPELLQE